MTRRTTRAAVASLGAATLLVASLGGTFAQSPSAAAPAGEAAPMPTSDIASYPNYGGEVDCANGTFNGSPYAGNLKSIEAPDATTVVFTFCNPEVVFLPKIAFASLAIDDAQYLIDHMPTSVTGVDADGNSLPLPEDTLLTLPNGTGPYKLGTWARGQYIDLVANDAYWGDKALTPTVEIQWNPETAARYLALQSGTVDGFDNPGPTDIESIQGDSSLTLYPRAPMNTFYVGMNNTFSPWTNQKVRQAIAMGIDRDRIVANFYPPGSEVAKFFTPCPPLVPFACEGDDWYTFDAAAAKALLAEGLAEEGIDPATFSTKLQFRAAVRPYLPDPPVIAQEIANQLQENLGITVELDLQDGGTFLAANSAGKLEGLFLLGWGADFPDPTNFLDYHFGSGPDNKRFGTPIPELQTALLRGAQSAADADRTAAYTEANNIIKEQVPAVIIAHGASGTVFKADVAGAHSSPLTSEAFSVMKPADRDILVFLQSQEPTSLYCGDETDGEALRVCEQIKQPLYEYEVAGTTPVPALATGCTSNDDATVWTCTLRDGVTFHDGSPFDASDVIVSFAAQWDARSPLHIGRTGAFDYWSALIGGGLLNPNP